MDNKIKIPWYRFNPKSLPVDIVEVSQPSFDLDINRPKPKPNVRGRVPVTEPVRVPVTSPVTEPSPFKVPQPDIGTNPYKVPDANPFGFPVPLPIPKPNPDMQKKPTTPTNPVPAFTEGWVQDWMKQTGISPNQNPNATEVPVPTNTGTGNKIVDSVLGGALSLIVTQKVAETTVNATLTDPVYAKMIETPVLGAVMKEAEKADADMAVVATYFANYDYNNFDATKMTKELSGIVGIASAIRMVAYFTARAITVK